MFKVVSRVYRSHMMRKVKASEPLEQPTSKRLRSEGLIPSDSITATLARMSCCCCEDGSLFDLLPQDLFTYLVERYLDFDNFT